jgi:hypothetical protein
VAESVPSFHLVDRDRETWTPLCCDKVHGCSETGLLEHHQSNVIQPSCQPPYTDQLELMPFMFDMHPPGSSCLVPCSQTFELIQSCMALPLELSSPMPLLLTCQRFDSMQASQAGASSSATTPKNTLEHFGPVEPQEDLKHFGPITREEYLEQLGPVNRQKDLNHIDPEALAGYYQCALNSPRECLRLEVLRKRWVCTSHAIVAVGVVLHSY